MEESCASKKKRRTEFYLLLNIAVIKGVSAFGAEFRRFSALFRFPAAIITFTLGNSGGFWCTAFGAEFSGCGCAAGAFPKTGNRRTRNTRHIRAVKYSFRLFFTFSKKFTKKAQGITSFRIYGILRFRFSEAEN